MFTFKNINNACSQIVVDEFNFLFDPWVSKGIYDGDHIPEYIYTIISIEMGKKTRNL